MLIRYAVENYRSIKTRQELSFVAGAYKDHPDFVTRTDAIQPGLLRAAVIYGPNASGKSNVIASLHFIARAVERSFRDWNPAGNIPVPSFKLHEGARKPSTFEIEFLLNDIRYEYGFTANEKVFTNEWLFAYPNRTKNMLFVREKNDFRFGKILSGNKSSIKAMTRPNSLFLSAAAQNNHSQLLPIYEWFISQLIFRLGDPSVAPALITAQMCIDNITKSRILNHLQSADLGIVDFTVSKDEPDPKFDQLYKVLEKITGGPIKMRPELQTIKLSHASSDGPVEFNLYEESKGTRAYFVLIGYALLALQSGSILVVDELDASLHPLLALEIVALFNNPSTNPKSAQLFFNTHDTNLLNNKYLRRDQIWFTEKDTNGETHLYPLSDFKSRNDENLEKGYLQGRFGAVPFISNSVLNLLDQDAQEAT